MHVIRRLRKLLYVMGQK